MTRTVRRVVRRVAQRRWRALLAISAGLALVGTVAALLAAWSITIVVVIFLQVALIAALVDVNRLQNRQHIELRRIGRIERSMERRAATIEKLVTNTSTIGRRTTRLERRLANTSTIERRTARIERRLSNTASSVLAAVELGRDESSRSIAEVREDLRKRDDYATSDDLRLIAGSLRGNLADQVRQIEAMLQLVRRVEPRSGIQPSGGWAMDAENLLLLLDVIADQKPAKVVELGGGTSTIWIAYALRQAGEGTLISIEHDEEYAEATRLAVERHGLSDVVDVLVAPLRQIALDGHETPWYDPEVFEKLAAIDLLVVDGPPQTTGKLARFPAVPLLWNQLSPNATVVLDDAHRNDEAATLQLWTKMFSEFTIVARSTKDHLIALRRSAANKAAPTSANDG